MSSSKRKYMKRVCKLQRNSRVTSKLQRPDQQSVGQTHQQVGDRRDDTMHSKVINLNMGPCRRDGSSKLKLTGKMQHKIHPITNPTLVTWPGQARASHHAPIDLRTENQGLKECLNHCISCVVEQTIFNNVGSVS